MISFGKFEFSMLFNGFLVVPVSGNPSFPVLLVMWLIGVGLVGLALNANTFPSSIRSLPIQNGRLDGLVDYILTTFWLAISQRRSCHSGRSHPRRLKVIL